MKDYKEMADSIFSRREKYEINRRRKKKNNVRATLIACVCLLFLIGLAWQMKSYKLFNLPMVSSSDQVADNSSKDEISGEDITTGIDEKGVSKDNTTGVYIEKKSLTTNPSNNTSMNMVGLIVYNGKIYTQSDYIQCDDARKQAFMGDYLGTASGNIDEWSNKELYGIDFASSVPGKVYSVKGYDSAFRICIPQIYEGCDFIAFFDNLNGITLTNGEDLYGSSRLSLKGNYTEILYQNHDDWNYEQKHFVKLNVPDEKIEEFINALYTSSFVDLSNSDTDIYQSNLKQTHLYFKMKDGITVEIRLFENGYIGYQAMHERVFVKMDNPIFNEIFNAGLN